MFINDDGNWVRLLKDDVVIYDNKKHTTIDLTPADASNNPEKFRYSLSFQNIKPKLKVCNYTRNADKRNIFSKRNTPNWNTELFTIIKF